MPAAPAYHLHVSATGSWQLRLFNLPVDKPAPAVPQLPLLTELAASALGKSAVFRKGVDGKLSVLRLAGVDRASLADLQRRLLAHGIRPAGAPAPPAGPTTAGR